MKKKAISILLATAMVLTSTSALIGCGSKEPAKDPVKNEDVKKGPIVLRDTASKVKTLNPHIYENTAESAMMSDLYGNMFQRILNDKGDKAEIFCNFAAEMPKMSEDGKTWTFKIKENLKWSDGEIIDANSFVESYKLLLDPSMKNYRANVFFGTLTIKGAKDYFNGKNKWEDVGIKAPDANTLVFELEYAIPEQDFINSFVGASPTGPVNVKKYKECMSADGKETKYGTSLDTVPCSGGYILKEWIRDQSYVIEKNKESNLAKIWTPDRIEYRVVEETSVAVQLFENKEIDLTGLSGPSYDKYEEDTRVAMSESSSVWKLNINTESKTNPILANSDLRKALFYGMDRAKIAKDLIKTAKPAPYMISDAITYKPGESYRSLADAKALVPKNDGFDTTLAKEYFEKAYKANGDKKITIEIMYFDTADAHKKTSEFLEQEYEKLFGSDKVDIKLKATPWQVAYENYESGKYDIGFGSWSVSLLNPWSGLRPYTSDYGKSKTDCFKNKEFDELYKRTVMGDLIFKEKERLEALVKMEKMLMDELPFLPIYQARGAGIYSERIKLKSGGKWVSPVGHGLYQSEIQELKQ